jgi:hypothetical protein
MAKRSLTLALVFGFAAVGIATTVLTVRAAGLPTQRMRRTFDKPWQRRSPPSQLQRSELVYDPTRSIKPATMRIQRAADGYVLFATPVTAEQEARLLKQGYRNERSLSGVRNRSIFNHEAYHGYMVGTGGPSDDEIKRLKGTTVKIDFKAHRGVGTPVIVGLTPQRP